MFANCSHWNRSIARHWLCQNVSKHFSRVIIVIMFNWRSTQFDFELEYRLIAEIVIKSNDGSFVTKRMRMRILSGIDRVHEGANARRTRLMSQFTELNGFTAISKCIPSIQFMSCSHMMILPFGSHSIASQLHSLSFSHIFSRTQTKTFDIFPKSIEYQTKDQHKFIVFMRFVCREGLKRWLFSMLSTQHFDNFQ